ncbi:MAG: helix-hairpin-helix domain-containing protein, partial [Synergistaceae bacterium]|nr:helix-hairpin-helix domain-containing protein [Synergistaceae bacterium]
ILFVYITGEIRKPGVYKLSEDTRIFQLVEMAGGFTSKADTESLNLAETLADGVHVHIGAKLQAQQEEAPRIPGMPAAKSQVVVQSGIQQSSGLININTATASELESLPGIGPAIAQRIIEYRNTHGNFSRPEDLINVRGIGQSKLAQVLSKITASNSGSRVAQPKSSSGLIDINRATAKELERLPGVGAVTAKRIVEYRQSHGAFTKPEDLTNIRGISWSKLEKMKSLIVIR